ncbi:MAG: hypothetical protein V4695_12570 [Pseudomonadota bacterium]
MPMVLPKRKFNAISSSNGSSEPDGKEVSVEIAVRPSPESPQAKRVAVSLRVNLPRPRMPPPTFPRADADSGTKTLAVSAGPGMSSHNAGMLLQWEAWAIPPNSFGSQRAEAVWRMRAALMNRLQTTLDLSGLALTSLPERLPENITTLQLSFNSLEALPEHLPAGLLHLDAEHNFLTTLPETLPASLISLNVANNQLSALPRGLPRGLKYLDAWTNNLTCLPENLPASLEVLDVDSRRLTHFPVKLPFGTSLDSIRKLTSWARAGRTQGERRIDVVNRIIACMHLRSRKVSLDLSCLGLTELPKAWPKNIERLSLRGNRLVALPATLPSNLVELDVSMNMLKQLPEALPASLQRLAANNNLLDSLPESLPKGLKWLQVSGNRLKTLPATLPPALEQLQVARNALSELPETLPANLLTIKASNNHLVKYQTRCRRD